MHSLLSYTQEFRKTLRIHCRRTKNGHIGIHDVFKTFVDFLQSYLHTQHYSCKMMSEHHLFLFVFVKPARDALVLKILCITHLEEARLYISFGGGTSSL